MRVLMVTQTVDLDDPVLGFTHTWVNALARWVERLHVVTLTAGRHHLAENVMLHAYGPPGKSHNRPSRFWFYNKHFARLILGRQVDVVFVHMIPRWVLLATPYAKARKVPVVLWYTHRAVSWQLRLAHRLADRVVTASPESYSLWDERKVVALGHGIDTEYFHPVPRQPDGFFRVLSVGRLSPVKQHEVLIEAARILVQERGMSNLRVRIVGGPARPGDEGYIHRLRRMVADYGLEEHIAFAGAVSYDKIMSEYQGCDLFVNLSRTDSLDKVVLEAMACGVLVVTSNPAFGPLLSESRWLVPHGDSDALAEMVAEMEALSLAKRARLGTMLRERVIQKHSLEGLIERLERLLVSLR
jgi:glycosyltransferase involved in cell wall biosynthesis